jgi:hypothetical protein
MAQNKLPKNKKPAPALTLVSGYSNPIMKLRYCYSDRTPAPAVAVQQHGVHIAAQDLRFIPIILTDIDAATNKKEQYIV